MFKIETRSFYVFELKETVYDTLPVNPLRFKPTNNIEVLSAFTEVSDVSFYLKYPPCLVYCLVSL